MSGGPDDQTLAHEYDIEFDSYSVDIAVNFFVALITVNLVLCKHVLSSL